MNGLLYLACRVMSLLQPVTFAVCVAYPPCDIWCWSQVLLPLYHAGELCALTTHTAPFKPSSVCAEDCLSAASRAAHVGMATKAFRFNVTCACLDTCRSLQKRWRTCTMQQTRCWPACTRSWAAEAAGLAREFAAAELLTLPASAPAPAAACPLCFSCQRNQCLVMGTVKPAH